MLGKRRSMDIITKFSEKKKKSTQIEARMNELPETFKRSRLEAIRDCGRLLWFDVYQHRHDAEKLKHKLTSAYFCKDKFCPMCSWRRSLKISRILYPVVEQLSKQNYRFLFITLTLKNCHVDELEETIQKMNKAWYRLLMRSEIRKAWKGTIRVLEWTRREEDGSIHPHFHALIAVKSTYFKAADYLKTERLAAMWGESLRVDYLPVCHQRVVKSKVKASGIVKDALAAAIAELVKYPMKDSDVLGLTGGQFEAVARALHKKRMIASSGVLKFTLDDEISSDDLDDITEEEWILMERLIARWTAGAYELEELKTGEVL